MLTKIILAILVIAYLVPAVLLMVLGGPLLIGAGIYEAIIGRGLEAAGMILVGLTAGAFAWWLTPGFLEAVIPQEGEAWFW